MEQYQKHIPVALLALFTLKLLAFGTSLPEMGTVFALSGVVAFGIFMERNKRIQELTDSFQKQLDEFKTAQDLTTQWVKESTKQIAEMKAYTDAHKVASGFNALRKV